MNGMEPIWGDKFINILSRSSMGLNLSRGKSVKYYSSDRISQLMGNGLLTFVDKNTFFGDFFTNKEIITYNSIDDLSYKLNKYKKDSVQRKLIAKNGKKKYMKYFNSNVVCEFIINKTFEEELKSYNKFPLLDSIYVISLKKRFIRKCKFNETWMYWSRGTDGSCCLYTFKSEKSNR